MSAIVCTKYRGKSVSTRRTASRTGAIVTAESDRPRTSTDATRRAPGSLRSGVYTTGAGSLSADNDGRFPTTPAIVSHGCATAPAGPGAESRRRRPTGFASGKNIDANRWLTIAVACPAVPSPSVNTRPRTSGRPKNAKDRGLTNTADTEG